VLLAEALLFLCNCDGDSGPTGSQSRQLLPKRAPVETVAKVLAVDASDFEPKLDPVAPPGDLHAEMESFTTVEACVQQRAHIDPMLGDALEAIGYDTFFADACRVVDAAKAGDAKRCLGIATSALRMHCRAAVAQLRATPNACPWTQPSRPAVGRDPGCVAIAARSAPLCVVEHDPVERAVCVALLDRAGRGAAGCQRLFSRAERERCTRAVARWRSALTPGDALDAEAALAPAGTLRVDRGDGEGGTTAIDLRRELENGTVLIEEHGGVTFSIGSLTDDGPAFAMPSPNAPVTFGIEIAVPGSHDGAPVGHLQRLELQRPGRPPLVVQSSAAAALTLHIDKLGRDRGSPVALTIEGQLRGESAPIHLEVATFVRDVVTAADALAAASRRGEPYEDDRPPNGTGR
jgi:hypothetical protein